MFPLDLEAKLSIVYIIVSYEFLIKMSRSTVSIGRLYL